MIITIAYFLVFLAALYLTSVSILAGFWGQFFVRRIVAFLGRASLIVFILSGVIFASALTMGKANQPKLLITFFSYNVVNTFCMEVSDCDIFLSFRCSWH